jgi:nitrate reductase NapE
MSDISNGQDAKPAPEAGLGTGRRAEFFVFAIIAALVWPVVAVGVVGGYGFLVWMSQIILGPPGPPGG